MAFQILITPLLHHSIAPPAYPSAAAARHLPRAIRQLGSPFSTSLISRTAGILSPRNEMAHDDVFF